MGLEREEERYDVRSLIGVDEGPKLNRLYRYAVTDCSSFFGPSDPAIGIN